MNSAKPASVKRARRNWWWPSVETADDAKFAVKQAFGVAVLCSAVTAVFALLGAAEIEFARNLGFDAWGLVDALVFAAIACGLWRHSRIAAWAGLVVYTGERMYMWSQFGVKNPGNPIVSIIFILAFIGGVRGTSALHAYKVESASLRGRTGSGSEDDAQTVLNEAIRFEGRNEFAAALAKYVEVQQNFNGTEAAKEAEACIQNLKAKMGDKS